MERIYNIAINKFKGKVLSAKDEAFLNDWLLSAENKHVFEELETVWKLTGTLEYKINADLDEEWSTFKTLRDKNVNSKVRTINNWWIGVAASVAILLGVFGVVQINKGFDSLTYTANNTEKLIQLPDNSEVWLNKNSTLIVAKNFNKKTRKVALNGEAFFEVEKNPAKPFIIETATGVFTKVLGTSFNLRAYQNEDQVELQVLTGTVQFGNKKADYITVSKNKAAEFNIQDQIISETTVINPNLISWKTKSFNFDNAKVSEVVVAFERYLNKSIIIPEQTAQLRFTGDFNEPTDKDFAEVISVAFNWNYKIQKDKIEFFLK